MKNIIFFLFFIAISSGVAAETLPEQPPSAEQLLNKIKQLQQTQQDTQQQIDGISKQILILQQKHPKDLQWVTTKNGGIPKNAFIAGYAFNKPLYICHSYYRNGLHPGQMVKKGCLISYGGVAFVQNDYEVLASNQPQNIFWDTPDKIQLYEPSSAPDSNPTEQTVIGGHENENSLYICRCIYNNRIHLGKQVAGNCNIGWQRKEIKVPVYEILYLTIE